MVSDEWRHTSLMRKILITNIGRLHRSENEAREAGIYLDTAAHIRRIKQMVRMLDRGGERFA